MIIRAYGDETGTHDGSDTMMLAGHVAALGKWISFDPAWRKALDRCGLTYFHGTEHWDTQAGAAFAPHIEKLVRRHLLLGYVVRLDKAVYRDVYKSGEVIRKPQPDSMYGICFRYLIAFLLTRLPLLLGRSDLDIEVVLEAGARGARDAERILRDLRKQLPHDSAMIKSVTFGDKSVPGLQAADALAFGAFKLEPGKPQLVDIPQDGSLVDTKRVAIARPPIFHCDLDAETLGGLKSDLIDLVAFRKRAAAVVKEQSLAQLANPTPDNSKQIGDGD